MAAAVSPAVLPPPQPREQKRFQRASKTKKIKIEKWEWKVKSESEKWECFRLHSLKKQKKAQKDFQNKKDQKLKSESAAASIG